MHCVQTLAEPQEPVVVIADSDSELCAEAHNFLDERGINVVDATSGDDALSIVDEETPDLILLDPTLKTSDGQDVLDVLWTEAGDDMPVVVLTSDDPQQVARGLKHGAHDYVGRKFHAVTLGARVDSALQFKHLREEVTRQRDTLDRLVRVDALTGLINRAQMDAQLKQIAATARRHERPLSIVLLDLDRFAHINDIAGREAGDMVLQDIARHVMADIRTGDFAGRWDGDEFMIVLPETDIGGAQVLAERLRLTICEFGADLPDGTSRPISASFGCAQGADLDDMMRCVKAAVTDAKRHGGNKIGVAISIP